MIEYPDLCYDLHPIQTDTSWVTVRGWCFMADHPERTLDIRIESVTGELLFSCGRATARRDVTQFFGERFPHLPELLGFEVRLPNFAVPRPFVVRAVAADGQSWVLSSRKAESLQRECSEAPGTSAIFRERYESLCSAVSPYKSGARGNVCFLVYSGEIRSGRGDLYVALGLGYRLTELGYGVRFLARDSWDALPEDTDIVVSMLPLEVSFLGCHSTKGKRPLQLAWMRNGIDEWLQCPSLMRYDGYWTSSLPSLRRMQRIVKRPSGLLRLAAEHEIFQPGPGLPDRAFDVISTINYWGNARELFDVLDTIDPPFDLAIFGKLLGDGLTRPLARFYREECSYFDLPRIYNSARVCLDCFNAVTQPYGNINSRYFEAWACGVPVLCNRPNEADPVLEDLQLLYHDADSLVRSAERLCSDTPYRMELAERGRAAIVSGHSWKIRAQEFDAFVQEHFTARSRSGSEAMCPPGAARPRGLPASRQPATDTGALQLGFYPPYLDNPYQHLMALAMEPLGIDARPLSDVGELAELDVFHLHWTAPITQPAPNEAESRARVDLTIAALTRFCMRGGLLVWTVKNVLPHELRYAASDLYFRRWLCAHATIVHLHSKETFLLAAQAGYEIPRDRAVITQLGNYDGYYGDSLPRSQARSEFGFADDEPVFLLFGQVRAYKGIELLVKLLQSRPDIPGTFLIAGEPKGASPELLAELQALGSRIQTDLRRIDDWEVERFFKAADCALLLSPTILNSASAVLALSYGLPVIGPRRGSLPELVTPQCGMLYSGVDELAEAILAFSRDRARFNSVMIRTWSSRNLAWDRVVQPLVAAIQRAAGQEESNLDFFGQPAA